jgi:hypothetical protein
MTAPWLLSPRLRNPQSHVTMRSRDQESSEYNRGKMFGFLQLAAIVLGLFALFLFFHPARAALLFAFLLLLMGVLAGFTDARSGRLDARHPPANLIDNRLRRVFPGFILVGAVVSALLSKQWVGAIADVLFFFAGAAIGVTAFILVSPAKSEPSSID